MASEADSRSVFAHVVSERLRCRPFFFILWRCLNISNAKHQINEEIRDKEVRLIDADGSQLGVMPVQNAMRVAINRGLDLVKIAPQAVPPVCKVMDYGKFKFEQAKREKEARKNQHVVAIKEVQLSVGIGIHDYNVKLNHAKRFLADGDKVKASIRFRGREMAHTSLGQDLLMRFADECAELGVVEKAPKLEGRQMLLFLAPKPASAKAPAKAKAEKAEKPETTTTETDANQSET